MSEPDNNKISRRLLNWGGESASYYTSNHRCKNVYALFNLLYFLGFLNFPVVNFYILITLLNSEIKRLFK